MIYSGDRSDASNDNIDLKCYSRFGYVFSAHDRVCGVYGRLSSSQSACSTHVEDFLICCTNRGHVSEHGLSTIEECLRSCGWERNAVDEAGSWQWNSYQLRTISNSSDGPLHVILSCGEGDCYLSQHLTESVPRHLSLLDRSARHRPSEPATPTSLVEALERLTEYPVVVYSGAGVSLASQIPTFEGASSLNTFLRLDEEFPGELLARMIADPQSLACWFRDFQRSLMLAKPNRCHFLLAELESLGRVHGVVSSNIDNLQERAGSTMLQKLYNADSCDVLNRFPERSALLVLGVSADDHGIVAAARKSCWPVFVVDPSPPFYLSDGDCFIQSDAEIVLDGLAQSPSMRPVFVGPHIGRTSLAEAIPDFHALLTEIQRRSTSGDSLIHGWRHWLETAWLGCELLAGTGQGNPAVVLLFSLLHDCLRTDDGADFQHGSRAAELASVLNGSHFFLSHAELNLLRRACRGHSISSVAAEQSIGICWDADRLGLWRIGVPPTRDFLSTRSTSIERMICASKHIHCLKTNWDEVYAKYAMF